MVACDGCLPCPFCGWPTPQLVAGVIEDGELVESPHVQCLECGAMVVGDFDYDSHAIAAWNRRTHPQEAR
jgi:Lar family restriction alleviation protein